LHLAPRYWALATFFIPIAGAIGYGVWLCVSAAGLAHSTEAEKIVRTSALLVLSAIFLAISRSWSRAIGVAFAGALFLMLVVVIQK
jgi:hypothetical protein